MADYYPVLKRAIGSLPSKSGEMRRAVYEKARTALVNQLKSYDPPLSPSEITDQRLQLEESIRRVEAEFADETFGLTAEPPAPAPVPAPPAQARIAAPETAPPPPAPAEPTPTAAPPVVADAPAPEVPRSQPPVSEPPRPAPPPPTAEVRPGPSGRGGPQPPASPSLEPRAPKAGRREIESYPPVDPAVGAGMTALQSTRRQAEELGGASAQAVQSARDAIEETEAPTARVEPGFMDAPRDTPRPERRPRADRPVAARPPPKPARLDRSSRSGKRGGILTWAIVVLLLLAAGAGAVAFLRPDLLEQAGLIGAGDVAPASEPTTVAEAPAETPVEPSEDAVDGLEPKILDRLPADGDEVVTPVAPDARTVQTERVVPPAETPAETPPGAGPDLPFAEAPPATAPEQAPPAAAPPATAPAGESEQGVAVAQKAILYEEPIPGSDGARIEGQVVWSYVNEPILPGEPPSPQIRATIRIPERNVSLSLSIRKNADAALPASHIVELAFALPPDFSGRFIETTPGLILKQTEDSRGDPLIGAVAKVADNLFWLALSGTEQDTPRNIALLKEREWVDVPIRYGNRRRAILTFEKGTPGDRAFEQAFQAWGQ